MRQSWTDDRMDDLVKRVDDGFAAVHNDIAALRADSKELRKEMATKPEELRKEMATQCDIDAINSRLDTLQLTINGGIISGIVTVIVSQLI